MIKNFVQMIFHPVIAGKNIQFSTSPVDSQERNYAYNK